MMRRRGSSMLETVLMMPLLILLLVGMVELARATYTYYTLQKIVNTAARYMASSQGVNFCADDDATIAAAKNLATTGSADNSTDSILTGLTPDQLQISIERYSAVDASLAQCECSATGCDASAGGQRPDFIVVSVPNGYSYLPRFPYLVNQPILFRPHVRVPYGGT
jgi:Flp pilus assembly protein TadG